MSIFPSVVLVKTCIFFFLLLPTDEHHVCPFLKSVKVLTCHLLISEFVVDCALEIYINTHMHTLFLHTSCIFTWMGNPAIIFLTILLSVCLNVDTMCTISGDSFLALWYYIMGFSCIFLIYANDGHIKSVGLCSHNSLLIWLKWLLNKSPGIAVCVCLGYWRSVWVFVSVLQ